MTRHRFAFAWALVALLSAVACHARPAADPFATLQAAYAVRDAEAAAAAYTEDGEVVYRYAGAAPERHKGRAAIAASFEAFFAGLDPGAALMLEFRFTHRDSAGARGFYRLRIGDADHHGRFDVVFAADGRFLRDTSSDATRVEFESVATPHMEPGRLE